VSEDHRGALVCIIESVPMRAILQRQNAA